MNKIYGTKSLYKKLNTIHNCICEETLEKCAKLTMIMYANLDFILSSFVDQKETDQLKTVAQMETILTCLADVEFRLLLVKCSLTNRIIASCKNKSMPPELISRIKDCMTAFLSY